MTKFVKNRKTLASHILALLNLDCISTLSKRIRNQPTGHTSREFYLINIHTNLLG